MNATKTKTCTGCREAKPLGEFHRRKLSRDGRRSQCKECTRRTHKAENERWRRNNPEKVKEASRSWRERNRGKARAHSQHQRERHPEKFAARQALNKAVQRGEIQRPDCCESCGGERRIQGHHADYDKPLEVEWLCENCHREGHGE